MITMTPYNLSLDIYNMQDNYMCVKYIFQHIEMTFILYKDMRWMVHSKMYRI